MQRTALLHGIMLMAETRMLARQTLHELGGEQQGIAPTISSAMRAESIQTTSKSSLTGVPLSEVKLSLLLNLERQSSFLGTWNPADAPGWADRAVFGDGRRSPWAAALRSMLPEPPASSLDCKGSQPSRSQFLQISK